MFLDPIRNWYGRYERPISSLSLILGFVFDAVTLHRVDTLWENIWIFGHIVIVGIFIMLIHVQENEPGDEKDPGKKHFWYVNILQFFFGGLLSAYLVFYFRSADIFVTWPFILLLAIAFIANESLKRHYVRFSFQISLFFISVYSFAIYILPVMLHRIGAMVFILAGIASLAFISIFIAILFSLVDEHVSKDKFESRNLITSLILGIFLLVNILYFTNLIPPIPLSLKDTGVFHSIMKNSEGNYDVTYEDQGWKQYFKLYKNFSRPPASPVYAFSAVFSPNKLNLTVLHEWQHYDEASGKWATETVVSLPVIGGRDGGFRTYSTRSNLSSGKWRVNIETEQHQVIGRLRFNILPVDAMPALSTGIR